MDLKSVSHGRWWSAGEGPVQAWCHTLDQADLVSPQVMKSSAHGSTLIHNGWNFLNFANEQT